MRKANLRVISIANGSLAFDTYFLLSKQYSNDPVQEITVSFRNIGRKYSTVIQFNENTPYVKRFCVFMKKDRSKAILYIATRCYKIYSFSRKGPESNNISQVTDAVGAGGHYTINHIPYVHGSLKTQ